MQSPSFPGNVVYTQNFLSNFYSNNVLRQSCCLRYKELVRLRVLTKEVYVFIHARVVRRKPKLCFKRQTPSSFLFFSVPFPRLFLCLLSKLFWPKITSLSARLSSKNKVPPAMKIRPHSCNAEAHNNITQRKKQRINKRARRHTNTRSHHIVAAVMIKEEANPRGCFSLVSSLPLSSKPLRQ